MKASLHDIIEYINRNPCAVLGTINDDGTPHGAVIYACALTDGSVCFLTKNQTQKYANLTHRPNVCITFCNERESSSLQVTGTAKLVTSAARMTTILEAITRIQTSQLDWLPPLSKLRAGAYETVAVTITRARLAEYSAKEIGSAHIFAEYTANRVM